MFEVGVCHVLGVVDEFVAVFTEFGLVAGEGFHVVPLSTERAMEGFEKFARIREEIAGF